MSYAVLQHTYQMIVSIVPNDGDGKKQMIFHFLLKIFYSCRWLVLSLSLGDFGSWMKKLVANQNLTQLNHRTGTHTVQRDHTSMCYVCITVSSEWQCTSVRSGEKHLICKQHKKFRTKFKLIRLTLWHCATGCFFTTMWPGLRSAVLFRARVADGLVSFY